MDFLSKIKKKIVYYQNRLFFYVESIVLCKTIDNNHSPYTIYLFSNPTHSNLGDQAQTYCILDWFKEYYPNYNVICVPQKITTDKTLNKIRRKLKSNDLLFVHSGYLIFDPHPELPFICDVVKRFSDRKIVILSQTIHLTKQEILTNVQDVFNNHSDLILMCRDEVSFLKAKTFFPNCKLLLYPDFVTLLIGTKTYNNKRNGILFCLRNDLEKFYSNKELDSLISKFENVCTDKYDTTIQKNAYTWKFNRKNLIDKVLDKFSNYQLIITDRYHGTIFSQITSTPVIVLSSSDHKLSSGVKWFPKEYFGQNVFFANDLDEVYSMANIVLKRNGKIVENSSYFKNEYFLKLQSILEN